MQSPRETRGSLSVQTLQVLLLLLVVLTAPHKVPLVHVCVLYSYSQWIPIGLTDIEALSMHPLIHQQQPARVLGA